MPAKKVFALKKQLALLVEDNTTIAEQISEFFDAHRWEVDFAHNGKTALSLAQSNTYDVIILDLGLPDIDGVKVCQKIKQHSKVSVPIIMLTARDAVDDKIEGFAKGADDYLTKPFNLRELIMRCKALARRHHLHKQNILNIAELEIELNSSQFSLNNMPLSLTPIGSKILLVLATHYPQPVSRSALINSIWGDIPPDTDALKAHIYGLRQTLNKHTHSLRITTVMHLGYRIEIQARQEA
jgi:DNA-binding response OmpR family regulator